MPSIVLHAVAEYARPVHHLHNDSIQAYLRKWLSSLPLIGAEKMTQDADAPECGVWVPVELLQALTAICPGLRAKAHPRANMQAVFLAERPYSAAYDCHISAQPRFQMAAQREQFSQPQIAYSRGQKAPCRGSATLGQRQSGGRAQDGDRGVCCVADSPRSHKLRNPASLGCSPTLPHGCSRRSRLLQVKLAKGAKDVAFPEEFYWMPRDGLSVEFLVRL